MTINESALESSSSNLSLYFHCFNCFEMHVDRSGICIKHAFCTFWKFFTVYDRFLYFHASFNIIIFEVFNVNENYLRDAKFSRSGRRCRVIK